MVVGHLRIHENKWLVKEFFLQYVLMFYRPLAAAPSQMKCKLNGSNQLPVGQSRINDVHINIKDKYGNDIVHVSIIISVL